MEDLRQELLEVTHTPVELAPPPPKPKKKKTPAKPTRAPEALEETAPKMTDKEKDNYIEYLRDKLAYANTRIMDLNDACDSAYNRVRETEDRIQKITNQANLKLNLIRDNIKVMANNVMTILEKITGGSYGYKF